MYSYLNPAARSWVCQSSVNPDVEQLHRQLPDYASTPLVPMNDLANELGIGRIYVKDESHRFGLPAFKILGAAWAVYRAVAAILGVPPTLSVGELGVAAMKQSVKLVACSDGNWGRAVARMARYLHIPATIFLPRNIDRATRDKIASEGARALVVDGDYDAAIEAAAREAEASNGLLVMDTSWPGYEEIPKVLLATFFDCQQNLSDAAIVGR
ncbi:hypothetical protein LTR04_000869 [Oleoguttula sp. CCFEE 6159]|nr:hypothetical protein LTR04_000869 [Oleoguttula sp. CCFEE 6159]